MPGVHDQPKLRAQPIFEGPASHSRPGRLCAVCLTSLSCVPGLVTMPCLPSPAWEFMPGVPDKPGLRARLGHHALHALPGRPCPICPPSLVSVPGLVTMPCLPSLA